MDGGRSVYDQLGLDDYLDQRLGTAETVELVAVKESLEECVLRIGRPEGAGAVGVD